MSAARALRAGDFPTARVIASERARLCAETIAHGTLPNAPAGRRLVALGAALQRATEAHARAGALAERIVRVTGRKGRISRMLRLELRAVAIAVEVADRDVAELANRVRQIVGRAKGRK